MGPEKPQLKSDQILENIRQTQRARDIVDVEMESVKLVVFFSAGAQYAFYGCDIKEILPACAISWVPGLPSYLPGLINIRGDIESVIDLRQFLGNEAIDPEKCQIAMAVKGSFRSGVMIDAIDDVIDIPVNSIRPPLATLNGSARDLVAGEFEHNGALITLLDIEKLAAKVKI